MLNQSLNLKLYDDHCNWAPLTTFGFLLDQLSMKYNINLRYLKIGFWRKWFWKQQNPMAYFRKTISSNNTLYFFCFVFVLFLFCFCCFVLLCYLLFCFVLFCFVFTNTNFEFKVTVHDGLWKKAPSCDPLGENSERVSTKSM